MKYLGNNANILRDAQLSLTNILASQSIYRTDDDPKAGGGQVELSGDFTGQNDATFEVEIVDNTIIGDPQLSAPSFKGVGNGTLTDLTATNAVNAQEITLTLTDLGTETRKAYAPFQGVKIQAKNSGTGGNDITVTISKSGLVKTATNFALIEDIRQGQNEYIGDHWNHGGKVINPDGTIPLDAPRLSYGDDPQIFRAYKKFVDGQYVHCLSPKPFRNITTGATVFSITGTYTIVITDGVTPESYTGIVTLYDLLSAIQTTSLLVEIVGVVAKDYKPSGMAIDDLSTQTSSYFLNLTKDGTRYIKNATIGLAVTANAPTEHIVIECKEGSVSGKEKWLVRGSVSGELPNAITDIAYSNAPVSFTIPLQAFVEAPEGSITGVYSPEGQHAEDFQPCFNLWKPKLGINATSKTLNFVYTKRPVNPCDCAAQPIEGNPSDECLGLDPGGGAVSEANKLRRLQKLTAYVREFVDSNTDVLQTGTISHHGSVDTDITYIKRAAGILSKNLHDLDSGTLEWPLFEISHVYLEDKIVEPIARNGYRYAVTIGGTSAATSPTWPLTVGATVVSGGVTFENIGKTPYKMWDDLFAYFKIDADNFFDFQDESGGTFADNRDAKTWAFWKSQQLITDYYGSPVYNIFGFNSVYAITPTVRNGHYYMLGGITYPQNSPTAIFGTAEPIFRTDGGSVVDGQLVWDDRGAYWLATHTYVVDTIISPYNGYSYICTTPGTSAAAEPVFPTTPASTVTDGTVVWTLYAGTPLVTTGLDQYSLDELFYERYLSATNDILAAAGIDPNFSSASGIKGNDCWQDDPSKTHWWICTDDPTYMPVFTNTYYHSVKLSHDVDGNPLLVNSKEFGFAFQFCEADLAVDDRVTVTINTAGTSSVSYQAGDRIEFDVNYSAPVQLGGGQTGNDTLTWNVSGTSQSFADYALYTPTPNTYSDGGLGFKILPGGIKFALGDSFALSVEGGRFKWRKDSGSWSSNTAIAASVALSDGLNAVFQSGAAPSWVTGDAWTFTAEAINGADQLRQPTDPSAEWSGSTVLTITPASPASASGVFLYDHTFPSDAVVTLQGSDDNFSTMPLNITLNWNERAIYKSFDEVTYAKYRITCDKGGKAQWVWLGDPLELKIRTGARELGKLTKRKRLPGIVTRKGMGATVEHTWLPQTMVDSLYEMLSHASEYDERRFAIVPNDNEPNEAALVEYNAESLEETDLMDFQPRNADRFISVSLTLDAAA